MEQPVKPPSTAQASAETLRCEGCGMAYRNFPLDLTIPDEQWMAIMGRPGGVLCANCIVERAAKLPGAVAVRARIAFGSEPQELASAETLEVSTYTPAMWVSLTTSDEQWAEYVRVRQIAADALRRLQSTEQEQFNGDHWFAEAQKQAQRAEAAEQELAYRERDLDYARAHRSRVADRLNVPLPQAEGKVWDAINAALDVKEAAEQRATNAERARIVKLLTALKVNAGSYAPGEGSGYEMACDDALEVLTGDLEQEKG